MDQSKLEAHSCNGRQARENASERGTIDFGFASHWLRKWREFYQPITEQNQRQTKANPKLLSTLNLKALYLKPHKLDLKSRTRAQSCCQI